MSLKFTRFTETVDVDHIGSISNGNITADQANPRPQNLQQPIAYLCQTKCQIIVGTLIVLLVIVSLVTGISYLVKCDEDKLIAHFEDRRTIFEKAITDWASLGTEESYKSQKIRWVVPTLQIDETVLEPGGNELFKDGSLTLYVARASHLNGTVVGKYCPHLQQMYIGYNGKEFYKSNFELLIFPRGTLSWINTNGTRLPNDEDLVYGGAAPISGESTFICRGKFQGHLFLGKFLQSKGKCLVAYKNIEFGLVDFEILAVNEMGRIIGVDA